MLAYITYIQEREQHSQSIKDLPDLLDKLKSIKTVILDKSDLIEKFTGIKEQLKSSLSSIESVSSIYSMLIDFPIDIEELNRAFIKIKKAYEPLYESQEIKDDYSLFDKLLDEDWDILDKRYEECINKIRTIKIQDINKVISEANDIAEKMDSWTERLSAAIKKEIEKEERERIAKEKEAVERLKMLEIKEKQLKKYDELRKEYRNILNPFLTLIDKYEGISRQIGRIAINFKDFESANIEYFASNVQKRINLLQIAIPKLLEIEELINPSENTKGNSVISFFKKHLIDQEALTKVINECYSWRMTIDNMDEYILKLREARKIKL